MGGGGVNKKHHMNNSSVHIAWDSVTSTVVGGVNENVLIKTLFTSCSRLLIQFVRTALLKSVPDFCTEMEQ